MKEQLTPMQNFFISPLRKRARRAVANRELTKAFSMKMVNKTREAYQH